MFHLFPSSEENCRSKEIKVMELGLKGEMGDHTWLEGEMKLGQLQKFGTRLIVLTW